MFRNYLKTAIRNLSRNKGYAFINILGLAIGISACILIFVVLRFETSFDNFHPKKDHIYRVGSEFNSQDGKSYSSGSSFPVAPAMRIDFPQIKEVVNIYQRSEVQITVQEDKLNTQKKFTEDAVFYTEPGFFTMFKFEWLAGDPKSALSQPNNVVLTQEVAEKYFGNWKAAIGQSMTQDNKYVFKVSGILKNVAVNTDFPLSIVVSYPTLKNMSVGRNLNDWVSTSSGAYTFVVLPPGYSPSVFNRDLVNFAKKHRPPDYAKDVFVAQPLSEIHYDERFGNYRNHTFSKSLINALILIGIFLLIIACVNFINLATAQAVNRSKEVGVRKVLGSNRKQLALQFMSETAFITIASVLIAAAIAFSTMPFLNRLLEVKMSLNLLNDPSLVLFLLLVMLFVTFLSGIYPAIILSGFNPIKALKRKVSASTVGGISIRRGLVVLQFTIAHILIIGTIVVVSQMKYFKNAALGFEKAAIINVPIPGDSISKTQVDYLYNQFVKNPGIKNVSFSFSSPSSEDTWTSDFRFDHATKNTNFGANLKWADVDYFKTYNLEFVAGRSYYPSDTVREFVVNQTLLKKLGISNPQDALGKEINFWDGNKTGPIVGVVRDFNSFSLREPMAPVVLSTWKDVYQTINFKIKPGQEKQVLTFVEKLWNKTFPDFVYKYSFLDQTIANFYKQENQLSQLYKIFAALAILISCLGLYGLVSFMAVQRTKEVGIRKVLGATAANIVYLLSKEFTLLIIIAFAIAVPMAWYIMNKWLQNFTYRIPLDLNVFLIAIVSSILIAWITVGHRAIKAATANPVKNLRTE